MSEVGLNVSEVGVNVFEEESVSGVPVPYKVM
jgi:hypothetical protein